MFSKNLNVLISNELKNTNYVYDNIISIPMHNYLKEKDVIDISDIIIKKIKKNIIKKW